MCTAPPSPTGPCRPGGHLRALLGQRRLLRNSRRQQAAGLQDALPRRQSEAQAASACHHPRPGGRGRARRARAAAAHRRAHLAPPHERRDPLTGPRRASDRVPAHRPLSARGQLHIGNHDARSQPRLSHRCERGRCRGQGRGTLTAALHHPSEYVPNLCIGKHGN